MKRTDAVLFQGQNVETELQGLTEHLHSHVNIFARYATGYDPSHMTTA